MPSRSDAHLMTSSRPTYAFESPNVATILRLAAGGSSDWPQDLPTALGAAFVALMWWRRREDWNWTQEFRWLVILSCLATSYGGWPFDLVVLVIPVVAEAARLVRVGSTLAITAGAVGVLVDHGGALALHAAHVPQALFIWMAPSVAIGLLAFGRIAPGTGAPIMENFYIYYIKKMKKKKKYMRKRPVSARGRYRYPRELLRQQVRTRGSADRLADTGRPVGNSALRSS